MSSSQPAEMPSIQSGSVQAACDGDVEKMIAECLSPIPGIRSVVCVEKQHGMWHLLITHDCDDLWSILDPVVDKIIDLEDVEGTPYMEPMFEHVSEEAGKLPPDAKTILKVA